MYIDICSTKQYLFICAFVLCLFSKDNHTASSSLSKSSLWRCQSPQLAQGLSEGCCAVSLQARSHYQQPPPHSAHRDDHACLDLRPRSRHTVNMLRRSLRVIRPQHSGIQTLNYGDTRRRDASSFSSTTTTAADNVKLKTMDDLGGPGLMASLNWLFIKGYFKTTQQLQVSGTWGLSARVGGRSARSRIVSLIPFHLPDSAPSVYGFLHWLCRLNSWMWLAPCAATLYPLYVRFGFVSWPLWDGGEMGFGSAAGIGAESLIQQSHPSPESVLVGPDRPQSSMWTVFFLWKPETVQTVQARQFLGRGGAAQCSKCLFFPFTSILFKHFWSAADHVAGCADATETRFLFFSFSLGSGLDSVVRKQS